MAKAQRIQKNSVLLKTKGVLFNDRTCWQSARSAIQKMARSVYFNSDKNRSCFICDYSTHIEICHIRAVADFPDSVTIMEINNIENLVALCPNHHWEFDNSKIYIKNV